MTRTRALRTLLLVAIASSLFYFLRRPEAPVPPSARPVPSPYEAGTVRTEWRAGAFRLVDSRLAVMGTRFTLEVAAPDEETARAAARAAWKRIAGLEASLSTWIDESLLSRVNRDAAKGPVRVDADTFDVLLRARECWRRTDGAFDPTVGSIVRLWRELPSLDRPPPEDAVLAALGRTGFENVTLDREARTVRFLQPDMALDLGGIAKGYAGDRAAADVLAAGATACRVNAGGDMTCRGAPPWDPRGFEVAIRDPEGDEGRALPGTDFHLRDRAVATSGNYERFTEIDGKRYSHIIDPRTGRPVPDAVTQVTVVAPNGAEADAMATALSVLGSEAGLELAERSPGLEALFLVRSGDGFTRVATSGFPEGSR